MDIQKGISDYLKKRKDDSEIGDSIVEDYGLIKNYSFTSVGGGSGSSTILLYVAQYLVKEMKKRVCILDLNLLEPDILYNMNVDITTENTLIQYLKGFKKLEDCIVEDSKMKGLYLLTASPKDRPELITSLRTDKDIFGKLIDRLDVFDYVLINLPYVQPFISFIEPISRIDRGYLVVDERYSSLNKIELLLKFLHEYQNKLNHFNNVILNKRSNNDYPLEQLDGLCDVIAQIPYDYSFVDYMNSKNLIINQKFSRSVSNELENVLSDMLK